MEKKSKISFALGILVLIAGLILVFGVEFWFHACGVHDDGGYGSCHWAQQAVCAVGIIIAIEAIILVAARNRKCQAALSAGIGCAGIVAALIPGTFINLCMMPSMHCNASMKPGVLVCGIVIAVLCAVNVCMNLRKGK